MYAEVTFLSKYKKHPKTSAKDWARQLLMQPSISLYQNASIYMSGKELELQNFSTILDYTENYLLVDLGQSRLRIMGDGLRILALEKGRLSLQGHFLEISFSEE